jgi:hypothetical protein
MHGSFRVLIQTFSLSGFQKDRTTNGCPVFLFFIRTAHSLTKAAHFRKMLNEPALLKKNKNGIILFTIFGLIRRKEHVTT